MIRLVHLSDIHFAGYGDGWDPNGDQRSELLRDLRRLVRTAGPVNGVLVGGDVAFRAAATEYETAKDWLAKVCTEGNCDTSAVWVVPGNHDLDRNVHRRTQARTHFLSEIRRSPVEDVDGVLNKWLAEDPASAGLFRCFDEFNAFAQQFGCATSATTPHWSDATLDLDGHVVCITGINSAIASDTSDCLDGQPTLVLGRRQCEIPRDAGHIRIAFAHHPPNWLRDSRTVEPFLRRAHLLLFGHEHRFKASQATPESTVTVHAGAVGPHESGDGYVPSWNMITLEIAGDRLRIRIEPRVWNSAATAFDAHPDGNSEFDVEIGLTAPSTEQTTPGTPATALVGDDPVRDEPADADLRLRLRRAAVAFMQLTPTSRMELARTLGVAEGISDGSLSQAEVTQVILQRIRTNRLIEQLLEILGHA